MTELRKPSTLNEISNQTASILDDPTSLLRPKEAKPASPMPAEATETELDRVRKIILGSDVVQQRLRKPEVDRLREILFGEQREEYERRFGDVHRDIERTLGDMRQLQDRAANTEKTQLARLDTLERDIRQLSAEIRRQGEQLQTHHAMFQQLLNQTHQHEMSTQKVVNQSKDQENKLIQQDKSLRDLQKLVEEHHDQSARDLNGIKREIREAEDKLYNELRRLIDRLNTQKTDRKTLAAMFMEVATRLETGASMTDLLGDLTVEPK